MYNDMQLYICTHACMHMHTQTLLSYPPAYSYRLHEQIARLPVQVWFIANGHGAATQRSEDPF